MNIVQSANRQVIRTKIESLNNHFGRKVFVQPRSKNVNGLWSPMFKGGIKKLPLSCPPRNKPIMQIVDGVKVVFKRSRTILH